MKSKKNLVFLGMMGSGKSSIGSLIAKKLQLNFIDIDNVIENELGLSIKKIFETKGENYFRELEVNALSEIKSSKVVVACGGGIILDHRNRKNISSNGKVIFLHASTLSLKNRLLSNLDRPLLNDTDLEKELKKIWDYRKKYYYDTAEITINTDDLNPELLSNQIIEKLNQ